MIPKNYILSRVMKPELSQGQRLFLSAGFEGFQMGLASEADVWISKKEQQGYVADQLSSALGAIVDQCCFETLTVFLLNGPGSTLSIRTLCAFVRTLLALNKITPNQVFTCDHLHFAQACLALRKVFPLPYFCARVNLTKTLCLTPSNELHPASEAEIEGALWLPHPCLKDKNIFSFRLDEILPLLHPLYPWQPNDRPDIVSY